MNNYLESHLKEFLSAEQIHDLLKSTKAIGTLPPSSIENVMTALVKAYNLQMKVMIGFSAMQIPLASLMWQKKQIVV
jgi:hypothetical protein